MANKTSDATFQEEVLNAPAAVVDFWAPWCQPCQMLGPVIDKLATEYEGKVPIFKLNVDENRETASKYHVMSIPTVLFFKNGEVEDQMIGLQAEDALKEKIDKLI